MKQKKFTRMRLTILMAIACLSIFSVILMSSSHREAPMIANDPLADNTDLYAFRSPVNADKIIVIANYIPAQLPQGGPNYYSFGENIRYEVHIDNNVATKGDDIVYRFTFHKVNEDPTTFFNIRLKKQNLKTTYTLERSMDGGKKFQTIITDGMVPPPNIGPRSISSPVGLDAPDYNSLIDADIKTSTTGERVFAGTADDPFFVDLGGIFDLGDAPRQSGQSVDGLKCLNVSTLAMEIDISTLQKDHKGINHAENILDPNYVIGVWASASRQKIRILNNYDDHNPDGLESNSGPWVQVSRLGMPLTNEAVIPIGYKDYWNRLTPYDDLSKLKVFGNFFYNPELALYMDDSQFGGAVPAFAPLRIQRNSLGAFDFGNTHDGLYILKNSPALNGTALAENAFGSLLLPAPGSPRSVDLWPIFNTGVPNLAPYQLATGKPAGNPLAPGKPFINNFLPSGGDMLRLNMAVPATPRDSKDFSSEGLVQAAVLGLTDPRFNTTTTLEFIPNMDGFPNGRRLEDDATRIELQAVSGIVLAAIGLWYDDYVIGSSPLTTDLLNVYTYSTGINQNDTTFKTSFPFVQTPWAGTHICACDNTTQQLRSARPAMTSFSTTGKLGIAAPEIFATSSPNPVVNNNTLTYKVDAASQVNIMVYDASGKAMKVLVNKKQEAGTYRLQWNAGSLGKGSYFISISKNGAVKQTLPLVKAE
ncbi:MAG: DUF4331 family protein [Ginsengibacter sp.]